ncbi:DUF4189 domain-containing protein [Dyella koreensis]|uniref:DUF4189 domain-containing protein n=2 Tax=Dyella koreensis TaxID=311235 RepID=A0ABW8K4J7_9GAMM
MRAVAVLLLLLCTMFIDSAAHAEGGCPPGMIPEGGQGVMSCRPIPGYDQGKQQQPPVEWASKWGAIATDATTGSLGAVNGASSANRAEEGAIADCRSKGGANCKLQVSYSNGCGVMVLGNKVFNAKSAATIEEATRKGIAQCSAESDGCHVYYSGCSLPQRIQ